MSGWFLVFLGRTTAKQQIKCFAEGHNTVTPLAKSQPSNPLISSLTRGFLWFFFYYFTWNIMLSKVEIKKKLWVTFFSLTSKILNICLIKFYTRFWKKCESWSAGFFRSQLIRIHSFSSTWWIHIHNEIAQPKWLVLHNQNGWKSHNQNDWKSHIQIGWKLHNQNGWKSHNQNGWKSHHQNGLNLHHQNGLRPEADIAFTAQNGCALKTACAYKAN